MGAHRNTGLLIACLGVAVCGGRASDLAAASPFMPSGLPAGAAGPGGPATPVELRGVMTTAQGVQCCIYDVARKSGAWVAVGEAGNDFVVRSVGPDGESATVSYQGHVLQLALKASKVASSGQASAVAVGSPGQGSGPGGQAPAALSPGDEQRRLDAVAAEVRRRRAERDRAFQASQPGGQPPAAPPAVPNR